MPYTPGGSTEILSRIIGHELEQRLGKPVIVENKPGAGTVIGATAVARAPPDGYATPLPVIVAATKTFSSAGR